MIHPTITSHLRADGESVGTKAKEGVEFTFRTKSILGRREQLYGHVNTTCS